LAGGRRRLNLLHAADQRQAKVIGIRCSGFVNLRLYDVDVGKEKVSGKEKLVKN